jgi:hypothetical protein
LPVVEAAGDDELELEVVPTTTKPAGQTHWAWKVDEEDEEALEAAEEPATAPLVPLPADAAAAPELESLVSRTSEDAWYYRIYPAAEADPPLDALAAPEPELGKSLVDWSRRWSALKENLPSGRGRPSIGRARGTRAEKMSGMKAHVRAQ